MSTPAENPTSVRRSSFVLLTTVVVGVISSMLGVAPAAAHAAYKFSNPDDESRVSQSPTEIWAEYTEPPTNASYLKVFDPCGDQSDNGDSRADPTQNRVYITQSSNRAGVYRVEWFVDSAADAHSTRGTFTFTVADGEPCPGAEPEQESEKERSAPEQPRERTGVGGTAPETSDREAGSEPASGTSNHGDKAGDRQAAEEGAKGKGRGAGNEGADEPNAAPVAAPQGEPDGAEDPGLLEGIPIGGLVVALTIAAAIGAAGGFIYAGIMGYHKPTA